MKVYIINFALIVLIGLVAEHYGKKKKAVYILYCFYVWLQLTLVAALRWANGTDYNQYYNTFYAISRAQSWSELLSRRDEIGFVLFNRGMSYITGNIITYLFAYYGIMYAILMRYIYKHTEIKWVGAAAFVAMDYFAMSLCFMRQSMAMVIGLYVMEMIKKRKWYWAVLLTLLASTFHISAIILLLALAVSYIDFSKRSVRITAVAIGVGLYLGCDFILEHILIGPFERYAYYLDTQFMNGNHILVVFYPIAVFVALVVFSGKLCRSDEKLIHLIPVLFLGMVMSLLSTKHYIVERMALYITIYNIRIVPQIMIQLRNKEDNWNFKLANICVLVISIGAFGFGILNDRYWIRPYRLNEQYLYQMDYFKQIEFHLEKKETLHQESLNRWKISDTA